MRILVFAFLTGCRGCDETAPAARSTTIAASDSAPEKIVSDGTRYDCDGIEPEPMNGGCAESRAPGDELVALNEELANVTAAHAPPTSAYWAPIALALSHAESVDPATLVVAERVALQNTAFHLSRVAEKEEPTLAGRAKALVKRLAFATPPAYAADLEPWIGPSSTWTERGVAITPGVHEQFFALTRVLRIVRTPTLRANFARLVAIDTSGKPFVSDVIGALEIRRGLKNDAAVCVVVLDPARVRCGKTGGMRAIRNLADVPKSPFWSHDAHVARCNSCHTDDDTVAGLKLVDGVDPSHDRKVLDGL